MTFIITRSATRLNPGEAPRLCLAGGYGLASPLKPPPWNKATSSPAHSRRPGHWVPHPGPGSTPRAGPSPPSCAGSCSLCAYQGLTHTPPALHTSGENCSSPGFRPGQPPAERGARDPAHRGPKARAFPAPRLKQLPGHRAQQTQQEMRPPGGSQDTFRHFTFGDPRSI